MGDVPNKIFREFAAGLLPARLLRGRIGNADRGPVNLFSLRLHTEF